MVKKKKKVKKVKAKKKRAKKYEKKLVVNTSFDEVIRLSTLDLPKKK